MCLLVTSELIPLSTSGLWLTSWYASCSEMLRIGSTVRINIRSHMIFYIGIMEKQSGFVSIKGDAQLDSVYRCISSNFPWVTLIERRIVIFPTIYHTDGSQFLAIRTEKHPASALVNLQVKHFRISIFFLHSDFLRGAYSGNAIHKPTTRHGTRSFEKNKLASSKAQSKW